MTTTEVLQFELTLDRLFKIVTLPDPEVRNAQITLAYSEMSTMMDEIIHLQATGEARDELCNANWFTMATWAVATIGPNIRSRELPRRADRLLPGAVRSQVEPWILSLRSSAGRRVAKALEEGQVAVFMSTMIHAIWFIEGFVWHTLEDVKTAYDLKDQRQRAPQPPVDLQGANYPFLKRKLRVAKRRLAECGSILEKIEDGESPTFLDVVTAQSKLRMLDLRESLWEVDSWDDDIGSGSSSHTPAQTSTADDDGLGAKYVQDAKNKSSMTTVQSDEGMKNMDLKEMVKAEVFDLAAVLKGITEEENMRIALELLGIEVDADSARRIWLLLDQLFTYKGGSHLTDLVAAFNAYERAAERWRWSDPEIERKCGEELPHRCSSCQLPWADCAIQTKSDAKACADRARTLACGEILRGNLIITAVEQVLLDPAVTTVVDHVPTVIADGVEGNTAVWLEQVLRVPRTLGRLGAARRLRRTNEFIRESWARVLTDQVLVLSLPTELLRVGRDIPLARPDGYFYPKRLRWLSIVGPEKPVPDSPADQFSTDALFEMFDRSRGDGWGTGAWDWRRFDERMNFAVNLFRSRQQEHALFWKPYNEEDRVRVMNNQVPLRFADPAAQNVVPTNWDVLRGASTT